MGKSLVTFVTICRVIRLLFSQRVLIQKLTRNDDGLWGGDLILPFLHSLLPFLIIDVLQLIVCHFLEHWLPCSDAPTISLTFLFLGLDGFQGLRRQNDLYHLETANPTSGCLWSLMGECRNIGIPQEPQDHYNHLPLGKHPEQIGSLPWSYWA